MPAEPKFSTLGWTYIGLSAAWTAMLLAGMLFLYHHRRLPFLQLRKLPLVFTAITALHMYNLACMVAYTIGPLIPCDAQYWIMSIYLPFGIALLQAANSQFIHVASQQKKFAQLHDLTERDVLAKPVVDPSAGWVVRMWQRLWAADKTTRIVVFIGIGLVVNTILTFIFYFGSEIFHPGYGFFNVQVPGTEEARALACVVGWEWWLSIVWQFFWAWVYAPYMLWKSRNIYDTHGWRNQTIWCCIAGLPATPLWLAGLYIPQMAPVNAYFIPPQWFSLSIFLIEIFIIFFPCWQVLKTHALQQETLDVIASWEQRNKKVAGEASSTSSAGLAGTTIAARSAVRSTKSEKGSTLSRSSRSLRESEMFTMQALETALRSNLQPLLEFAALKDFSGENVSFLSHVAEWKRAWTDSTIKRPTDRDQFIRAVQIYSHFISLEFSPFPVNVSARGAKGLFEVFDAAAKLLVTRRLGSLNSDSVTPFDDATSETSLRSPVEPDLEATLGKANLASVTHMTELSRHGSGDLTVPPEFGPEIFDAAEKEIKYLVLTNTWPRYVLAGWESSSQTSEKTRLGLFCGMGRKTQV